MQNVSGKIFHTVGKTFQLDCDFAFQIGWERLISISNFSDRWYCIVTVWYWKDTVVPISSFSLSKK